MTTFASWNVNSLRARLDHVLRWLDQNSPDIIGLQETKVKDEEFPFEVFKERGYHAIASGQKSYNGVAILCKQEPVAVDVGIRGFDDPQKRALGCRFESLYFLNLYVPNGQTVGSEKYAYKLAWLDALIQWLGELQGVEQNIVIVGDFNIAPADRDVHDPTVWRGKVLCSDAERARLRQICELGFIDTFRSFDQAEGSFSWWDYRAGAYRRNHGLRIDLILVGGKLAGNVVSAGIDRTPRGWEKPSDHAPILTVVER